MIEVTLLTQRHKHAMAVHVKLGHQDCHLMRNDVMYCAVKGKGVPVCDMKAYGGEKYSSILY